MGDATRLYWTSAVLFSICRERHRASWNNPTMDDAAIEQLQEQNRQLRVLVDALNATLLRRLALETVALRSPEGADPDCLVREAEECFRLARLSGLKSEIAEGLETAGHELMGKAVEIETKLQRAKTSGDAVMQARKAALEANGRALLRLSQSCGQKEIAEELNVIAHVLLNLERIGLSNRENKLRD